METIYLIIVGFLLILAVFDLFVGVSNDAVNFLNSAIGALYFTGIIDKGILILIAIVYSICDIICILYFCPFQTWFMKNRCCTTCRIYNWDFAMMFTPLVFIPSLYTYSLLGCAVLLLLRWEITYRLHPERFSVLTNKCLDCSRCEEKLCSHKKQLKSFLRTYKTKFFPTKTNINIDM